MGLDPGRQEIRWEDTKKKHKGGDKKKGTDRYFFPACRLLLRSQPPLQTLPRVCESSDVTNSNPFLPLEDIVGESEGQPGKKFSQTGEILNVIIFTKIIMVV